MFVLVTSVVFASMFKFGGSRPNHQLELLHPDITSENEVPDYDFPFVTREGWKARAPKDITPLSYPVPYVVVHHSYTPSACYNNMECCKAMRSMQDFHMDGREWWDIGYNFAVGSDGTTYEGRGWRRVGAHSLHFNTVSTGICLIGDWSHTIPPSDQIKTAQALIAAGVELGYIRPDYKLVGHRQVRDTQCPGEAFYENLKTWRHFSPHPANVTELWEVVELPKKIRDLLRSSGDTN